MKQIILLFSIFLIIGCNGKQTEITKKKTIFNDQFWKNREAMKSTNDIEKFPIAIDSNMKDQRTNRIYLRSSECQFEVFVNDVILFKAFGDITKNGAGITGAHDINQLMLTSGKHEVKVRMYPKYGMPLFDEVGGYLELNLSHFRDRDLRTVEYSQDMNGHNGIELSRSDKQWISEYDNESKAAFGGEYKPKVPIKFNGIPMYEWKSVFHAQVPYDHTGWRESVDLKVMYEKNVEQLESDLLKVYYDIHNIIKTKNTAAYLSLVKEREDLITSCLLYKDNEKTLRESEFINLIKNEDYELQPIIKETFKLEFQAYGNLVMFLNKVDGEGIIRLKNKKDPDDIIFLDFKFHKKTKDAQLTII